MAAALMAPQLAGTGVVTYVLPGERTVIYNDAGYPARRSLYNACSCSSSAIRSIRTAAFFFRRGAFFVSGEPKSI